MFVFVIPKEGLFGVGSANPSFGMTPPIKYDTHDIVCEAADYIVGVIRKEELVGLLLLIWEIVP